MRLDPDQKLLLKKIGRKIQAELTKRNKPIEWLSFRSGVARSTLREIMAGRSNPRIMTLDSIAHALGWNDIGALLASTLRNSN